MVDLESLGLGGALVAAIGAIGADARARNGRNEKLDGILANLLRNEQEAHSATRQELSQARTGESLALAQAATFGAQAEQLTQRMDDLEQRLGESEARNEDCERRNAELTKRVFRIERRTTPPNDTPAIESGERSVRLPVATGEVTHVR